MCVGRRAAIGATTDPGAWRRDMAGKACRRRTFCSARPRRGGRRVKEVTMTVTHDSPTQGPLSGTNPAGEEPVPGSAPG